MTAVFVTHDQEEAFALSDRIAVLDRGRLQQLGTPEELYDAPANPFVAAFLGRADFLPATLESRGDVALCRLAGGAAWRARIPAADGASAGAAVRVMVRPESLRLVRGGAAEGAIPGRVTDRRFAGAASFYRVALADGPEITVQGGPRDAAPGDAVAVALADGVVPLAFAAE
jgi:ABC-type Fe3+/spermidine/putrescine transport system ATPase subunit